MTEKEIFNLLPVTHSVYFCSIENGTHLAGYPDVNYFKLTGNGTIEIKVVKSVEGILKPRWERGQLAFNKGLQQFSNKVFLLIYWDRVFYLVHYFKPTYTVSELKEACLWCGLKLDSSFLQVL